MRPPLAVSGETNDGVPQSATMAPSPLASALGWKLMPRLRYLIERAPRYFATRVRRFLLDRTEAKLDEANIKLETIKNTAAALQSEIAALKSNMLGITASLDALTANVNATRTLSETARSEIAAIPGLFGPRFDELEIKVRALVPFDADSYALRLADGYLLAPRDEPILLVMLADATSSGLEPGTRCCLKTLLDPGMTAADVGANIGLHTLACARAVGPAGRVYAFEPEPKVRGLLAQSLRLNGLSWVDLRAQAAGARTEHATFNVSSTSGHSSLYPLPEDGFSTTYPIEVEVARLDDLIPAGVRLDAVKIDVEGAELDVLAGMSRLIADSANLAIIAEYGPSHLARVGTQPQAWFAAFAAHGFVPLAIEEPSGKCRPIVLDDLTGIASINLAFVRPGSRAEARLWQRP